MIVDVPRDARAKTRAWAVVIVAFVFASSAAAGVRASESGVEGAPSARRSLVDVTGAAFFDVFGFELSASAAFDPICEFLNPFLHPDYRLSACAEEQAAAAEYEDEYEAYGEGRDRIVMDPEGTFVNGVTGNVAGGIGGGGIGGVAGGSAGFIGGGLGGVGGGVGAGPIGRRL